MAEKKVFSKHKQTPTSSHHSTTQQRLISRPSATRTPIASHQTTPTPRASGNAQCKAKGNRQPRSIESRFAIPRRRRHHLRPPAKHEQQHGHPPAAISRYVTSRGAADERQRKKKSNTARSSRAGAEEEGAAAAPAPSPNVAPAPAVRVCVRCPALPAWCCALALGFAVRAAACPFFAARCGEMGGRGRGGSLGSGVRERTSRRCVGRVGAHSSAAGKGVARLLVIPTVSSGRREEGTGCVFWVVLFFRFA